MNMSLKHIRRSLLFYLIVVFVVLYFAVSCTKNEFDKDVGNHHRGSKKSFVTEYHIDLYKSNNDTFDIKNNIIYENDDIENVKLENPNSNIFLLKNIDEGKIRPTPDQSSRQIFFLETSHPEGAHLQLNERKACAIESAAYMHPNHKIFVLIIGNTTIDFNSKGSKNYKNLIRNYPNIFFRRLDIHEFMTDTPLESFHKWKVLNQSKNYNVYLADILRLVALYKYGGLYFDTDVVVLKNFENLGENYMCIASHYLLMSGTFQFSSVGVGHETVEAFLKNALNQFNGNTWGSNGPLLVTRVMKRICNAKNTEMMNAKSCNGINILSRKTFLPISYQNFMYYFDPKYGSSVMRIVRNAYTAHIFNHMNHHIQLKTSEKAGYVRLAEKFCPVVYKNLAEYF